MSPTPLTFTDEFQEINDCSELQKSAIDEITKGFEINTEKLKEIVEHFRNEMNKGLACHGHTVPMVPSYGNQTFLSNFYFFYLIHTF